MRFARRAQGISAARGVFSKARNINEFMSMGD
jgi:hypothetical protein